MYAIRSYYGTGQVPDTNRVRYEILNKFGFFVTESSEHFAEYTPWFIKRDRPDLIEKFNVPLDEYPRRCVNQMADWAEELRITSYNVCYTKLLRTFSRPAVPPTAATVRTPTACNTTISFR